MTNTLENLAAELGLEATTVKDIGNQVICDHCSKDYTTSDAKGGFLFGSYGTCPDCVPRLEASARKYNEEHHIKERALPGEEFRDFILRIRNGNNLIITYEKSTNGGEV